MEEGYETNGKIRSQQAWYQLSMFNLEEEKDASSDLKGLELVVSFEEIHASFEKLQLAVFSIWTS